MRIVYRDFWGETVRLEFRSCDEMWTWLKRWYPIVKGLQEMGEFIDEL